MSNMFEDAEDFDGDISSWNTSSVLDMDDMFLDASDFNIDLSGWCVTNINSEPNNFAVGSLLTTIHKPVWGTCPA
jgi:surface protein